MSKKAVLPPPPTTPPPPVDPPKAKAKTGPKPYVAGVALADQPAVRVQQAIAAGFVLYLERHGASIQAIWESGSISNDENAPLIKDCISLQQFNKSANAMRWVERRRQHWEEVGRRVQAQLLDSSTHKTLGSITQLEQTGVVLMQHIVGDSAAGIPPVKPRSLEGAVRAFVDVTKLQEELRGGVIQQAADAAKANSAQQFRDEMTPGLGQSAQLIADDDGISEEQVIAMARAAALVNASLLERQSKPATPVVIEANAVASSDIEKLKPPVMEPL